MNAGKFDPSDLPEPLRRKLQSQLDRLPEQYRHNIEAQLSRLPTDQLRQLVERGSPMLDKLIARVDAASVAKPLEQPAAPTRSLKTSGHYNRTVQPGDKPTWLAIVLLLAAVALAVVLATGSF